MPTGVSQPNQPIRPFGGYIAPNNYDQTAGVFRQQSGFRAGRVAIADPSQVGPFTHPADWDTNNVILSQGNCLALFGIGDYADYAADAGYFYPPGLGISFDTDDLNSTNAQVLPILYGGTPRSKAVMSNNIDTPPSPLFVIRGLEWRNRVRFHLPTGANTGINPAINGGVYGLSYIYWTEPSRNTLEFE